MFSKISFLLLFFLISCTNYIKNPVEKYNKEFLSKNYVKISKIKNKHIKIANENNIYYRDNKSDLVDREYYQTIRSNKSKKEYNIKKRNEEIKNQDIKYLDYDLSLYYKERKLKDPEYIDYDKNEDILFLAENYPNYSKKTITFNDVEPNSEQLYGTIKERKEKNYNYISNDIMQENFDYIYVMNRVKNEIYLQQKNNNNVAENKKENGGVIDSVLNKFKNLFKK